MKKKGLLGSAGILIFMVLAGVCYVNFVSVEETNNENAFNILPNEAIITGEAVEPQVELILVHVCGCVELPGVYELTSGSRVMDAVNAAGGFLADAAKDAVNLAAVIKDEQRIYIPNLNEVTSSMFTYEESGQALSNQVNLNTASKEQLMTLPGIGEAKADSILAYREAHGSFTCVEDIMKIPGIKQAVFEALKERIVV